MQFKYNAIFWCQISIKLSNLGKDDIFDDREWEWNFEWDLPVRQILKFRETLRDKKESDREKWYEKRKRNSEKKVGERKRKRERGICYGNIYLLVASILVFVGSWLATNSFLDLQTKTNTHTKKITFSHTHKKTHSFMLV